ncbi:helix-turn-helix domain-containing protein [Geothrix sp. 21YS21S-2]|uniref:helix-turn-helix domain-containing protein n=1 Tax=Geothrix sp. 21YS21S-2 TaxID=3068893 RepID=UPI00358F6274
MAAVGSASERLKTFRLALGLTGVALAKALGRSKGTVTNWDTGRTALPLSACLGMEAAFGVSAKWLMDGTGSMWLEKDLRSIRDTFPGLVVIPIAPLETSLEPSGAWVPPAPGTEAIGLPPSLVTPIAPSSDSSIEGNRVWIRISDPLMRDTLGEEAHALVDTSLGQREIVSDHALYLVRTNQDQPPSVRRLAVEPTTGDLVVACDGKDKVPMRLGRAGREWRETVLGRVIWILRRP